MTRPIAFLVLAGLLGAAGCGTAPAPPADLTPEQEAQFEAAQRAAQADEGRERGGRDRAEE